MTLFVFAVPPTPFDALDYRSILLPYLTFYRDALGAGEFPFWNPHASLGRPFAADPQAIVFWPPALVYLALDAFWGAIVLAWLHTWLAAWSSARLCLHLGAQRMPALLSGFVFVMSGKVLGHYQAGHLQFVFSFLYLPLLLYAGLLVQERGSRRSVALLGFLAGWQLLAGAPQVYWVCALGLALFLTGRRLAGPAARWLPGIWADGWRVAAAYAAGLALAAALLVPLATLIAESNRAAPRPEFIAAGSMAWRHWASVVTPWTAAGYTVDWELLLYPGCGLAALAVAGLLRRRDTAIRAAWLVLAIAGLLAAGDQTPLFAMLVDWLPGYAAFRVHGRFGTLLVYMLVLAATLFVSNPGTRTEAAARLGAGFLVCGGVLLALRLCNGAAIGLPLVLLMLAGIAAAAAILPDITARRRVGAAALALVLLGDLGLVGVRLKETFITAKDYSLERPLADALRESGHLAPGKPPPRIFAPPDQIRANAGMIHGFATLAGSEALALRRVWNYLHWSVGKEPPMGDIYGFAAFAEKGAFPIPWVAQVAALDLSAGRIEVLAQPPPRAWLTGRVRVVPDWQEAVGRAAAGHDPTRSTLVESAPLGFLGATEADLATIQWGPFSRNHLELTVNTSTPAVLAISEAWYPGWNAEINGTPTPVFPANGWMRGLVVPAGASTVKLSYYPPFFAAGIVISLATLALLLWLARSRR